MAACKYSFIQIIIDLINLPLPSYILLIVALICAVFGDYCVVSCGDIIMELAVHDLYGHGTFVNLGKTCRCHLGDINMVT